MQAMKLITAALALSLVSLHAQSDNRYCNKDNTWLGTSATNPVLREGPASLPQVCFNTDLANTPSPGPVIVVGTGQSLQKAYDSAECGSVDLFQFRSHPKHLKLVER